MNQKTLEEKLASLPMGGIHYYPSVSSTNDVALRWSEMGADDFTLIIADTQTNGRGRCSRRWFTLPQSGLALSLILRPDRNQGKKDLSLIPRYTGLGALAVCQVLKNQFALPAQIKWPNDVLINNRKCCGILVEAQWSGDQLLGLILGIGINISRDAIPVVEGIRMMATSVELALAAPVDRVDFLSYLLSEILKWRMYLKEEFFLKAWESNLAFLGKQVKVVITNGAKKSNGLCAIGKISGLDKDGALKLRTLEGENLVMHYGEIMDRL